MKTRTQIFPKINKNNFIKLKHIYIGSANYNKHKKIYWLIMFVSYNDSSLLGLWHPLNTRKLIFATFFVATRLITKKIKKFHFWL
jgi:hypothetical protein